MGVRNLRFLPAFQNLHSRGLASSCTGWALAVRIGDLFSLRVARFSLRAHCFECFQRVLQKEVASGSGSPALSPGQVSVRRPCLGGLHADFVAPWTSAEVSFYFSRLRRKLR